MKKFAVISYILVLITGFVSCTGVEWDTRETFTCLSKSWASEYLGAVIPLDEVNDRGTVIILKDTLSLDYHFKGCERGDSINITTSVKKFDDSVIASTEGYRFSNSIKAHIFTVSPGIVNYSGTLHIDFYETGKSKPWAWTEVVFDEAAKEEGYSSSSFTKVRMGWY